MGIRKMRMRMRMRMPDGRVLVLIVRTEQNRCHHRGDHAAVQSRLQVLLLRADLLSGATASGGSDGASRWQAQASPCAAATNS